MTSQLNVDTIVDKAGSGGTNVKIANNAVTVSEGGGATTTTVQGLCKSWIDFKGTSTAAINDSFNIGSLTDLDTGKFRVTYTNDMSSGDYTIVGSAFYSQGGGFNDTMVVSRDTTQTQTSSVSPFYLYRLTSSEAIADAQEAHILYHGDLA
tara:strand:+ start:116 stop:568 length:453 start_codon:yes stop_codon:yes gene_type:complete